MQDQKITHIQNYLDAAKRQDFPKMLAAFTDDLVYRVPGTGPLSGVTKGKGAALDYFGAIMKITEGSYTITDIVDWLASSDRVALMASETATCKGQRLDWTRVMLFGFRDGLISEVTLFDDKLTELDALLGTNG